MKSSSEETNASGSSQMKRVVCGYFLLSCKLFRGLDKLETLSLRTNGKNQRKPEKGYTI